MRLGKSTLDTITSPDILGGIVAHPCPLRKHHEFRDWLAKWLVDNGDALVLPIDEAVVTAGSTLAGDFKDQLILPSPSARTVALSKYRATLAADQVDIAIPKTHYLREPRSSELFIPEKLDSFPQLLKWDNAVSTDGKFEKGGNRIVHSMKEIQACCAELAPYDCGIILQRLVPGHGVGAFFLRDNGKIILRFGHRRLHEVPWTGGVSALCESSDDPEVLAAGEKLLEAIDYEGVAMVEFRKEEGKPPVFLEINGRLWGSLGLALAAGADFPRAMVECHLHGETQVLQPDLSRRIRWREPKLEMDYLHSLWTKKPGPCDAAAPRLKGLISVIWNMVAPRTVSDWRWQDGCWTTLRRHLGLWRREAAWLKQALLRSIWSRKTDPLLVECIVRTNKLLEQASHQPPKSILFLCYGNICRSPYAEYRWKQKAAKNGLLPLACSAGFHQNVDRPTPARFQGAARHRGVDLRKHRSKRISKKIVDTADWIFVMDVANLRALHQEYPNAISKTLILGACDHPDRPVIPDPYAQTIGAGGEAYRRIDAALIRLHEKLIPVHSKAS